MWLLQNEFFNDLIILLEYLRVFINGFINILIISSKELQVFLWLLKVHQTFAECFHPLEIEKYFSNHDKTERTKLRYAQNYKNIWKIKAKNIKRRCKLYAIEV